MHALCTSVKHLLINYSVPVLLQCALVRLACLLNARATALCTQRLKLVYELLVNIKLVKLTSWESVLSQNITGKLFVAVIAVIDLYIFVLVCTKSVLFCRS